MSISINSNYNPLIGFGNPLLYDNYDKYLKTELKNESIIKNFFSTSEKINLSIDKELKKLSQVEYISVDDYLGITKNIMKNNRPAIIKLSSTLFKNQDYFIDHLFSIVDTLYTLISDEIKIADRLKMEKNIIKRVYLSTVLDIQKKLLLELKNELEKSKKRKVGNWSKVPIINRLLLGARLMFFKRFERAAVSNNIISLRLTKFFDKDKIKKEIDQAYDEFAKANLIEPSKNYDKYNKYLSGIIKS